MINNLKIPKINLDISNSVSFNKLGGSYSMIKATFFVEQFFLKNRIFDLSDKISNRDNCLYGFYLLKEKFREKGIEISTQDINLPFRSKFIIYENMPKFKDIILNKNNYLIMLESKIIKADNYNIDYHKYFKKIFTWDDVLVDNKKYIKINYPQKIPEDLDYNQNKKENLCTTIVANKFNTHSLELYTERKKAIRWFDKNHPEEFDFYGMGWDEYYFKGILSRLNRVDFLLKIMKPRYSSYKGSIESKKEILKKYKFAICYENARDIPGYITEKIFDCFFSYCVPIYLGAPNITEHILADTFIDRRKFKTYKELYNYLKNMSDKEYVSYLDAIKNFIKSDKIYPFRAECFADIITNEIIKEL